MNKLEYNTVVVGAGPVGLYASFVLSMFGLKTCIIDSAKMIGGQCTSLYPDKPIFDIPGHVKILARDLVNNLERQLKHFEVDFHLSNCINSITTSENGYNISTTQHEISSKALVLAIGEGEMKPRRLDIENIDILEKKGYIHYTFKNINMFKGKRVAIAGGGDSAADCAIELANVASEVVIFHRRSSLRCMDATHDKLIQLSKKGRINIKLSAIIKNINELLGSISISCQQDEIVKEYGFDHCIVCYGSDASKTVLSKLCPSIQPKINRNSEIIIDSSTCLTSTYGVYAIGDCAGYGEIARPKLISIGFGEASIAAHHIRKVLFSHMKYRFAHSTTLLK